MDNEFRSGITMRLGGGLGNQLFQYAAGRAMSVALDVPLFLDVRLYVGEGGDRPFVLDYFNHVAKIAKGGLLPPVEFNGVIGNLILLRYLMMKQYVFETKWQKGYDPRLANPKPGQYFGGAWQKEQYFSAIEPILRRDFEFKTPPSAENQKYLERINNCLAVSIHARRGDYVATQGSLRFYAQCSPDYYTRGANYIISKLSLKPTFFVFSDDMKWAKENIKLDYEMVFVEGNRDANSYEDLRLMAACQHNIIANSTFSWWGAWLNAKPDKITVAPRKWVLNRRFGNNLALSSRFVIVDN